MNLRACFGEVDDRERDAGLAIGRCACPMDDRVLAMSVDDEDALAPFMKSSAEVHRNGALTDPALLLCHSDDFCRQVHLLFLDAAEFYLADFLIQMFLVDSNGYRTFR